MDPFDVEFCRLAGYSNKSDEEGFLQVNRNHSTVDTEINTSYSCIFNWASMRYIFISNSVRKILGYEKELFLKGGFNFSLSIIHPADIQKLRDVHLAIFNYYYRFPSEQRTDLRFSYNFRIRTADNQYIHLLRQSTFGFTINGKPTLEYVNSTDITGFNNNNNNITLTVHQISSAGTYVLCYEHEFSENYPSLSEREKQVLELVKQGFTTREIACKLYLSIETIKSHRKHIIAKTGAGNMTAAINKIVKQKSIRLAD